MASLPNIIISGVPGTGKSTLAKKLAEALPGFSVIDVGKESETRGLWEEYDEELQTWIVDEDKVRLFAFPAARLRNPRQSPFTTHPEQNPRRAALTTKQLITALTPALQTGGQILDWLHAEPFSIDVDITPIHLVITMHASNTTLYDRYAARGYSKAKIDQNLDAEIMDEIGQENREAFEDADGVTLVDLQGETTAELEGNVKRVVEWVGAWKRDQEEEDA